MSDERLPFLNAIERDPYDALVRLVYADFLDERYDPDIACQQMLTIMMRYVLERPDENAHRLAYADICERYGYHQWAAFVRLQCGNDVRAIGAGLLLSQLSKSPHQHMYFPNIPGGVTNVLRQTDDNFRMEFRRGFVQKVVCTAANWLMQGQLLLRRHPVECVALSDYEEHEIQISPRTTELPGWVLEVVDGSFPWHERWYDRRSDMIEDMPVRLRQWGILEQPDQ